jgi:hypothetical protein
MNELPFWDWYRARAFELACLGKDLALWPAFFQHRIVKPQYSHIFTAQLSGSRFQTISAKIRSEAKRLPCIP